MNVQFILLLLYRHILTCRVSSSRKFLLLFFYTIALICAVMRHIAHNTLSACALFVLLFLFVRSFVLLVCSFVFFYSIFFTRFLLFFLTIPLSLCAFETKTLCLVSVHFDTFRSFVRSFAAWGFLTLKM